MVDRTSYTTYGKALTVSCRRVRLFSCVRVYGISPDFLLDAPIVLRTAETGVEFYAICV